MKKILPILFLFVNQTFSAQTTNIDSLKNICSTHLNDTNCIEAYIKISEAIYLEDVENGISYGKKALQLLSDNQKESTKKTLLKGQASYILCSIYLYKGIMDSAIIYGNEAITIFKKYKKEKELAETLIILGSVYDYQARNEEALKNYSDAQQLFEKVNDTAGIALSFNNLAIIYYSQGDRDIAIGYFEKAIELDKKIKNYKELIWSTNNLGNIYLKKKKYEKALQLFREALSYDNKVENRNGLAYTLKNLGNYYLEINNLDSALFYHKKDLELYTELKGESGIALSHTNVGRVYFKMNDYAKAKKYGEKAYSITKELNLAIRTFEVAELMKDVYQKTNEYKKALEFTNLWYSLRDSMRNANSERAALRQRMQSEYDKKEAINNEQHKQALKLADEREQKQQIITISVTSGLGLVVVFLLFVFNRLKVTRKQKSIIELAHSDLEEKNREILDSINYAKRIQAAILPPDKLVKEYLQNSFILYLPKDIVAGDFYWMETVKSPFEGGQGDVILFAAADCTGHGVPGAMVSVICNNGLNRAVREYGLTSPGKILDKARDIVLEEFDKSEDDVNDGMDIALCSLNVSSSSGAYRELQYAGANNPLWIVRNEEIIEYKGDKQPIGKFDNPTPYTTHTIELQKGDTIYIFSDGYADQFGGEKGKKFKAANFKELLLSVQKEDMQTQKEIINKAFAKWKGNLEQIDDVCVIGVRV